MFPTIYYSIYIIHRQKILTKEKDREKYKQSSHIERYRYRQLETHNALIAYFDRLSICFTYFIKNISSSTTHKKTLKLWNYGILASAKPSPNDFPTLCKQFSARFPQKREGDSTVPYFALWLNFWIRQYPYNSHIFRVMIYTSW